MPTGLCLASQSTIWQCDDTNFNFKLQADYSCFHIQKQSALSLIRPQKFKTIFYEFVLPICDESYHLYIDSHAMCIFHLAGTSVRVFCHPRKLDVFSVIPTCLLVNAGSFFYRSLVFARVGAWRTCDGGRPWAHDLCKTPQVEQSGSLGTVCGKILLPNAKLLNQVNFHTNTKVIQMSLQHSRTMIGEHYHVFCWLKLYFLCLISDQGQKITSSQVRNAAHGPSQLHWICSHFQRWKLVPLQGLFVLLTSKW